MSVDKMPTENRKPGAEWGLRRTVLLVMVVLGTVCLSGCVPGDGASTELNASGFFSGVWHGWIAPITLIWGFFNSSIRIYEPINVGWWYDLGYYMAVISPFGGLSLTRRPRSPHED